MIKHQYDCNNMFVTVVLWVFFYSFTHLGPSGRVSLGQAGPGRVLGQTYKQM